VFKASLDYIEFEATLAHSLQKNQKTTKKTPQQPPKQNKITIKYWWHGSRDKVFA
jgi:hypothetical protein